jgi:hypothetical protein
MERREGGRGGGRKKKEGKKEGREGGIHAGRKIKGGRTVQHVSVPCVAGYCCGIS